MEILNLQLRSGPGTSLAQLMPLLAGTGASVQSTSIPGLYEVRGPSAKLAAVAEQLAASRAVQFLDPMQTLQIQTAPNDPSYTNGTEWGLNGTWGINAPTAWNTTTGSNHVIVADVDTGINYNNSDLINNIWLNQAEIPSSVMPKLTDVNGDGLITFYDLNNSVNQGTGKIIDTNKDGVITGTDVIAPTTSGGWASGSTQDGNTSTPDDLIGWNFVNGNDNPMDSNGHGTVTAGEIGAVGNNGIGVSGVEWNAQIMDLQAFDSSGGGSDVNIAQAIDYAVNNGAKVINASWGGAGGDPTIAAAIQYADQHGVIIVAAAGNDASNDTTNFFSPASYSATYPNVISVAATDNNGNLAGWSDYGVGTVQLAAPGVNIYSTYGNGYAYASGTSMAAPFVTGTVALVEAAHPTWSMSQVVDAVVDHTTPDPALAGMVTSGGIVNAAAAVANTDGAYITCATPNGQGTTGSPLSSVQLTFNEEINPATFTPSQVTLTGPNGTISGITVSAVSGSNNHQFLIAFSSQTGGGSYTLTVGPSIQDWYGNSMDQNRDGVNGQSSDAYVATFAAPIATLVQRDTTTQGNWIGAYGSQGYNIIGNAASYPSYATVTPSGQSSYNWAASTNDTRALETPGGSSRIPACWDSSTSFSINVDLTDGQTHDVALYAVDWEKSGRSEQIQITNGVTGAVLDTETISSFSSGTYLQWAVSGDVTITVTKLAGCNAVLSGLFFDPPHDLLSISSSSTTDTAGTAQNFTVTAIGPNGSTDTNYAGTIHFTSTDSHAVLPANYTFTAADAGVHSFSVTLETAGTQSVTATDTANQCTSGAESNITVVAAAASSLTLTGLPNPATAGIAGNFTVTAYDPYGNVAGGYTGTVHFTSSDSQASLPGNYTFKATDAGTHTFSGTLKTTGTQSITATDTATTSITGSSSVTVVSPPSTSAAFVKRDTTTAGNWIGTYGAQGYNIIGNAASYPSYATVAPSGQSNFTWAGTTTDPRALQTANGSSRIAACWYSGTSFSINVYLTDGQSHDLALYAVDWDSLGRSEQIQITNAATKAVLDTETVSSFSNGVYLQWAVSGDVVVTVTMAKGTNAVVSGLFFDAASGVQSIKTYPLLGVDVAAHAINPYGSPAITEFGTVDLNGEDTEGAPPDRPYVTGAGARSVRLIFSRENGSRPIVSVGARAADKL